MIHYAVVTGRPTVVDRLVPELSGALAATSTFTGEHTHHVAADHTWAAAGLSMADPTCDQRLVADEQSMVVFNGPAISATGDQRDLGGSVLRAFRAEGTTGVARVLGGTYNLVGASPDHGVRGLVDFSGLAPLYWHEGSDVVIFSNRSSTVANLAGNSGWDLRALGWLIGHSNLIDAHVPAPDVDYLVPGCEARVPIGEPRLEVVRGPTWVWADPSEDAGRDNLADDTWDAITGELVETFRSFASFGEPIRLGLTGGKDSRLCLALIKAAGLEHSVRVSTNGSHDSPEVEVALAVAERAGVRHRRAGPPAGGPTPPAPSPPAPEEMWRRLRQHAYRYESMVCPWDGTNDPLSRVVVGIKGVY